MKIKLRFLVFTLLTVLLFSCQQEVDLDLIDSIANYDQYDQIGIGSADPGFKAASFKGLNNVLVGINGSTVQAVQYVGTSGKIIDKPIYVEGLVKSGNFIFLSLSAFPTEFIPVGPLSASYEFCLYMPTGKIYKLQEKCLFHNGIHSWDVDKDSIYVEAYSGSIFKYSMVKGKLVADELWNPGTSGAFSTWMADRHGNIYDVSDYRKSQNILIPGKRIVKYPMNEYQLNMGTDGIAYFKKNTGETGYFDENGIPVILENCFYPNTAIGNHPKASETYQYKDETGTYHIGSNGIYWISNHEEGAEYDEKVISSCLDVDFLSASLNGKILTYCSKGYIYEKDITTGKTTIIDTPYVKVFDMYSSVAGNIIIYALTNDSRRVYVQMTYDKNFIELSSEMPKTALQILTPIN